jgi:hypothetical protein
MLPPHQRARLLQAHSSEPYALQTTELGYSCGGILFFHKLDVPRIAELTWKFSYSATGNTDKIDILQLGLADVTWVR